MEKLRHVLNGLLDLLCLKWLYFPTTEKRSTDSEFTAEVVRITQIQPHTNADKLEIARFELDGIGETSYEVVIQKSSFKVGDLAAYFSVDCVLPLDHPDFKFLASRPDGAGKSHFRLRAARLRGVYSQGLLVPAPDSSPFGGPVFGQQVAEQFGVTYHRDPEPEEKGGPTASTKKPKAQPMSVYKVDSLKKLPRLFELGEQVVITEKIHGTNFRFGWVRRRFLGIPIGWRFVVGSHHVIKGNTGGGFYGEDLWSQTAHAMKLAEKVADYRGYHFYGELYGYTYSGQAIQDLTYGRKPDQGPGLAMFDVKSPTGEWLSPFERESVLADVDLPSAPWLYVGDYHPDFTMQFAEGKSTLCKGIREGCVVETVNSSPRRKAKYVGESYLMRKDEHKDRSYSVSNGDLPTLKVAA